MAAAANERGVVSAASYEARKFGVHSAMPLRTAAKLCPQAIFVAGHPERYREYSAKVYEVLDRFSPKLEMVSIDEAYVDMTGTERLHGPPMRAAHALHVAMKSETQLNCSIGIGTSRLIAKVCSDQAKPNGVLWIVPGGEAEFLAPLDVRKIPGVGKVMEKRLHEQGIRKVGDLAARDERWLEQNFGALGVALAGKSRGLDAGGWFDADIGEDEGPKLDQPRAHVLARHRRCAGAGGDAGAAVGDGVPPPARTEAARPHSAIEAAQFRFPHPHPRSHRCRSRARWTRRCWPRSANCSARTGRATRCGCWGCHASQFDSRERAARPGRRRPRTISGTRRSPPPTACARSLARTPSRWPPA